MQHLYDIWRRTRLIIALEDVTATTRREQAAAMGISLSTLQSLISGRRRTLERHVTLAESLKEAKQ